MFTLMCDNLRLRDFNNYDFSYCVTFLSENLLSEAVAFTAAVLLLIKR